MPRIDSINLHEFLHYVRITHQLKFALGTSLEIVQIFQLNSCLPKSFIATKSPEVVIAKKKHYACAKEWSSIEVLLLID